MTDKKKPEVRYVKKDDDNFTVNGKSFCSDNLMGGAAIEVIDEYGGLEKIGENFSLEKAMKFINSVVHKYDNELGEDWGSKNIRAKDVIPVALNFIRFFTPDLGLAEATNQKSSEATSEQA